MKRLDNLGSAQAMYLAKKLREVDDLLFILSDALTLAPLSVRKKTLEKARTKLLVLQQQVEKEI